jgi:hypothetical protein
MRYVYRIGGATLLLTSFLLGCSGSEGGGGDSSGGAGGATSPVTVTCQPNQAKLAYDGAAEQSYDLRGWPTLYAWDHGTAAHVSGSLGAGWYDIVFEPEFDNLNTAMPGVILDTKPWPVRTALLADATAQVLGPMRCVAPGSGSTLSRKGSDVLLNLKRVDVIAACRDHPLDGQINLCFKFDGCTGFDGGSVAGAAWILQPDTWTGSSGNWQVSFQGGSYMQASTTDMTAGPAYWALIATALDSPYGGKIYCASGGSIEQMGGSDFYDVIHLANLGVVDCAAAAGVARGCLQGKSPQ